MLNQSIEMNWNRISSTKTLFLEMTRLALVGYKSEFKIEKLTCATAGVWCWK